MDCRTCSLHLHAGENHGRLCRGSEVYLCQHCVPLAQYCRPPNLHVRLRGCDGPRLDRSVLDHLHYVPEQVRNLAHLPPVREAVSRVEVNPTLLSTELLKPFRLIPTGLHEPVDGRLGMVGLRYFHPHCVLLGSRYHICADYHAQSGPPDIYGPGRAWQSVPVLLWRLYRARL